MPTVAQLNVDVDADITGVVRGLAEVQALIRAFEKNRFADLRIGADISGAADGIKNIDAMRRKLAGSQANLRVGLNGGPATVAQLMGLNKMIDRVDGRNVVVSADARGIGGAVAQLQALSMAATRASGSVRLTAAAILMLAPAAIPALGAVTVGVMALAASFGAAGAGATLFALVMTSVYKPVTDGVNEIRAAEEKLTEAITDEQREAALEDLAIAWSKLTPTQAEAAQTLIDFRDAWSDFAAQFEPEIFALVDTVLRGIIGLFPEFAAVLGPVIAMFQDLAERMFAALDSERGQAFFDWLAGAAAPALDALVTSLGNIIAGFAGMMMAFGPVTEDFQGGMVDMTARFREWAWELQNNPGFQKFIAYIRENVPKVISFLKSLWEAFTGIIIALAPAGEWAIAFLGDLLDSFRNLVMANPVLTSVFALLIAGLIAVLKFASPLLAIAQMLLMVATTFLAAGGAAGFFMKAIGIGFLMAFAGALLWAYTHLDWFKAAIDGTAQMIMAVLREMAPALMAIVGAVLMLLPPFLQLITTLLPLVPIVLQIINVFLPFVALAAGLAAVIAGKLVGALISVLQPFIEWLGVLVQSEGAVMTIAAIVAAYFIPTMIRAGVQMMLTAGRNAAAWIWMNSMAISGLATQMAVHTRMVVAWIASGVHATAQAIKHGAAWLIITLAAKAAGGSMLAQMALVVVGWITMGAQAIANGIRMAAGWLMALGPIGLLLIAIAAVAAAVWWVYENWDGIVEWFKNLWERVVGWFEAGRDAVMEVITLGMHDSGEAAGDAFESGLTEGTDFTGMGMDMQDMLGSGMSGIPDMTGGMGLDATNSFAGGMITGMPNVSMATGMLGQAVEAPASQIEWDSLLAEEGQKTIDGLTGGMLAAQTTLEEECITIPEKMSQWVAIGFTGAQAQLALTAEEHFGTGITTGISAALPRIETHLKQGSQDLGDNLNMSAFQGAGGRVVDNLILGYDSMLPRITGLLQELPSYLVATMPADPFSAEGQAWMEEVVAGIRAGKYGLASEVINLPWEVAAAIPPATELFTAKGKEWMDAVGNGVMDGQVQVNALMSSLPEGASLILSNGVDLFSTAGMKWADAVGTGVQDGVFDLNAVMALLPPEAVAALAVAAEGAGFDLAGAGMVDDLTAGALGATPDLEALMAGIPPGAEKALGDTSTLLQQPGADMVSGLGAGITGEVAMVDQAMLEIKTAITTGWDAIAAEAPVKIEVWKANVALGFAELRGTVITGMTSLDAQFDIGMTMMGQSVVAGFTTMNGYVSGGFVALTATTNAGMATMRGAVLAGFTIMQSTVDVGMAGMRADVLAGFLVMQSTTQAGVTAMRADVLAGFLVMRSTVVQQMTAMHAGVTAGWTSIRAITLATLLVMRSMFAEHFAAMTTTVRSGFVSMNAITSAGVYSMRVAVANGMAALVASIRAQVGAAGSAASALASAAVSGVAWLPGRMYDAGQSAGWSFAQGLRSMGDAVRDAAEYLAGQASGAMPGSPAEWGPLSGDGYTYLRGQRFAEDLARGIASGYGNVAGASLSLAGAMDVFGSARGLGRAVRGAGGRAAGSEGGVGDIIVESVEVSVTVGGGTDPEAARRAFDDAGDELAVKLAEEIRRRGR